MLTITSPPRLTLKKLLLSELHQFFLFETVVFDRAKTPRFKKNEWERKTCSNSCQMHTGGKWDFKLEHDDLFSNTCKLNAILVITSVIARNGNLFWYSCFKSKVHFYKIIPTNSKAITFVGTVYIKSFARKSYV